jgi:uncharacterized protein HemX
MMDLTHEHLKTLFDLLRMQQQEIIVLGGLVQQRDSQISELQHQVQALEKPPTIATNGLNRVPAGAEV